MCLWSSVQVPAPVSAASAGSAFFSPSSRLTLGGSAPNQSSPPSDLDFLKSGLGASSPGSGTYHARSTIAQPVVTATSGLPSLGTTAGLPSLSSHSPPATTIAFATPPTGSVSSSSLSGERSEAQGSALPSATSLPGLGLSSVETKQSPSDRSVVVQCWGLILQRSI